MRERGGGEETGDAPSVAREATAGSRGGRRRRISLSGRRRDEDEGTFAMDLSVGAVCRWVRGLGRGVSLSLSFCHVAFERDGSREEGMGLGFAGGKDASEKLSGGEEPPFFQRLLSSF